MILVATLPYFKRETNYSKEEEDWMIIVTSFLKAKTAIRYSKEHVTMNVRR